MNKEVLNKFQSRIDYKTLYIGVNYDNNVIEYFSNNDLNSIYREYIKHENNFQFYDLKEISIDTINILDNLGFLNVVYTVDSSELTDSIEESLNLLMNLRGYQYNENFRCIVYFMVIAIIYNWNFYGNRSIKSVIRGGIGSCIMI